MKKLFVFGIALLLLGLNLTACFQLEENPLLTQEAVLSQMDETKQARDAGRDLWYDLRFRYQKNHYDVLATQELLSLYGAYLWEETQPYQETSDESIIVSLMDGYEVEVFPDGRVILTDTYAADNQDSIKHFRTDPAFHETLKAYIQENRQSIPDTQS